MSINKKQFNDIRESINEVIPALVDSEAVIFVGNNKFSCKNGIKKFTDRLGITKKDLPNYFCELGQPGFMTGEDLLDLGNALRSGKKYIK